MSIVGLRDLSRATGKIVEQVEASGEPVIITRQGNPVAALIVVDHARLEDLVLSAAPEFVDSTREADEALAAGETRRMSEIMAEADQADQAEAVGQAEEPAATAQVEAIREGMQGLVDLVTAEAASEVPDEVPTAEFEQLREVNARLVEASATELIEQVAARVKTINENTMQSATHGGSFSMHDYLATLETVTEALTSEPAEEAEAREEEEATAGT